MRACETPARSEIRRSNIFQRLNDLWTYEYFKPLLNETFNVVGQLLSKNLLNAHGKPRVLIMATYALVAKALEQTIKTGQLRRETN